MCGPFEAYLATRGLRSLPVRMELHSDSAFKLATALEAHPRIQRVFYPGLLSHPQHVVASKQMRKGWVDRLSDSA